VAQLRKAVLYLIHTLLEISSLILILSCFNQVLSFCTSYSPWRTGSRPRFLSLGQNLRLSSEHRASSCICPCFSILPMLSYIFTRPSLALEQQPCGPRRETLWYVTQEKIPWTETRTLPGDFSKQQCLSARYTFFSRGMERMKSQIQTV